MLASAALTWTMIGAAPKIPPLLFAGKPRNVPTCAPNGNGSCNAWADSGGLDGLSANGRRDEPLSPQFSAHGARGDHQPLPGRLHLLPARPDRPTQGIHVAGAVRKHHPTVRRRGLSDGSSARLRRTTVGQAIARA